MPILTGHYWLQTVPDTHSLVALDITDPEHPREVSSVAFGDDEPPHWIAIDRTGRRDRAQLGRLREREPALRRSTSIRRPVRSRSIRSSAMPAATGRA